MQGKLENHINQIRNWISKQLPIIDLKIRKDGVCFVFFQNL